MAGQNCPHLAFWNSIPIRVRVRREIFSGERIFRGGIETRASGGAAQFVLALQQRKLQARRLLTGGMTDSPQMRAYRPFASISGARNSRLSGQTSGCGGHHRRHPSLVGARRLRPKMGAENCEDRRATRRTRFSRTKAICGWQRILPHLPAISRDASATATTKLYS